MKPAYFEYDAAKNMYNIYSGEGDYIVSCSNIQMAQEIVAEVNSENT